MSKIFFLQNEKNFLRDLTKKDSTLNFNEFYKNYKKAANKLFYLLGILIVIFIIAFNYFKYAFLLYFILIVICLLFYIYRTVLEQLQSVYTEFINLCKLIVKLETFIKNSLSASKYSTDIKNKNLDIISKSIQVFCINNNKSLDNKGIDDCYELYKVYLNEKKKFFNIIFSEFDSNFTKNNSYVHIYINCNTQNILFEVNAKIEQLIQDVFAGDINFDILNSNIKNILPDVKDDESNELINKIFNLLNIQNENNVQFVNLAKLIADNKENKNNAKIEELLSDIVNKAKIQLINIENFKKELFPNNNNEEDDEHENDENKEDISEDIKEGKKEGMSLLELELNEIRRKEIEDRKIEEENKKRNESIAQPSLFDLLKGEKEFSIMKGDLISELKKFYENNTDFKIDDKMD